jgi:REP element-mobilizing transposase RayT
MYVIVVMPDHVHMIFKVLPKPRDNVVISLPEVMSGIKGATSHEINRLLGRRGPVWEEEFFDRVVRSSESLDQKIRYVRENPVRASLVREPKEYQWLWTDRDWD